LNLHVLAFGFFVRFVNIQNELICNKFSKICFKVACAYLGSSYLFYRQFKGLTREVYEMLHNNSAIFLIIPLLA